MFRYTERGVLKAVRSIMLDERCLLMLVPVLRLRRLLQWTSLSQIAHNNAVEGKSQSESKRAA